MFDPVMQKQFDGIFGNGEKENEKHLEQRRTDKQPAPRNVERINSAALEKVRKKIK